MSCLKGGIELEASHLRHQCFLWAVTARNATPMPGGRHGGAQQNLQGFLRWPYSSYSLTMTGEAPPLIGEFLVVTLRTFLEAPASLL